MLVKISYSLLELVYPRLCAACEERLLEQEKFLCLNCIVNLPQTHFHLDQENSMFLKFSGRVKIELATALFYFTSKGKIQRLIHQFKYKNQPQIGIFLGELLAQRMLENEEYMHFDLIIPVPLHDKKERERGYNQSMYFALGLSKVLGKPCTPDFLVRITDTATQTRKSKWERWQNVNTTFHVNNSETLMNKHILLVDDVLTTGATLEACTEKLLMIEGVKVSIATIAIAS